VIPVILVVDLSVIRECLFLLKKKKKNDSWRPTIEYPMRSAYREACGKEPGKKQNLLMLIQYLCSFFIATCAVRYCCYCMDLLLLLYGFIVVVVQATRAGPLREPHSHLRIYYHCPSEDLLSFLGFIIDL
jgi:hypothetical protein